MITKYKNIFSKCYTEKWLKEIFVIDSVLKNDPWRYKIKHLNETKLWETFMKKKCCWVNYKWVMIQN